VQPRVESVVGIQAAAAASQDDSTDRRHQQQQRCDLEREQVCRQEQLADVLGAAEAGDVGRAVGGDALERGAEHGDAQLDRDRQPEQRTEQLQRAARTVQRLILAADVGDDEHVQDHHRARVHDHLGGGDELGAQQQEQRRQRDQVTDERQHVVERIAQHDHADRPGQGADGGDEEQNRAHGYSPSLRSGVRSIASASSISLVKMRSERV